MSPLAADDRRPGITRLISHVTLLWYALLVLLLLLMLGLSALNGQSLSAVAIKLREGQIERRDHRLPLLGKPGEELPDYRLSYLIDDRWHVIGTRLNQSAADWLSFGISDPPNLTLVQGLRVVEDDPAEDDPLEEVQVTATSISGRIFDYRLETSYSFKAGMDWFARTPLGIAIFGAIAAAVFLVVLAHIGSAL